VSALARVVWGAMRPPVLLLLVMYAATGTAAAGSASLAPLARALLVVVPFLACSAVVNDLADHRVDRVNLPGDARRAYAAGTAHRRHLAAVAALGGVGALAAAWALGPVALATTAAGLLVSTAYSLEPVRLSRRGIVAPLVLPACYVTVPFVLGAVAARGEVRRADLPLLVALYVGFIGRIVLKDFRDLRGDALFGKRTFLVRRGRRWTCGVSAAAWSAGSALLLVARPATTTAHVVGTVALAGLALVLLRELSAGPGHRRDEWLVAAVAVVGRGQVLVLLTDLAAPAAGWPSWLAAVVTAGFAASFAGQAWQLRTHGPSRGAGAAPVPDRRGAGERAAHPLVR
jgi:4-hydroxybenzoate polyprenyltransferase